MLATITNDGWYGDSAAPRQHLALAILRAAEARRYLVRAANTGISAVIDPYGRLVTRLGFGREGLITAEVRPGSDVTPAVAYGGAIRAGVVLVAAGVIILGARRRSGFAGPADSPSPRGGTLLEDVMSRAQQVRDTLVSVRGYL